MNPDRDQYIKELEAKDRRHRMEYVVTGGVINGGWVPFLVYEGVNLLIGRQTHGEGIYLTLAGSIVGPTIAFLKERGRQKREQSQIKNIDQKGRFR